MVTQSNWNEKQAALAPWRAFLTAHAHVVTRLESELEEETGLPLSWYEVLLILREAPEGCLRMHELADRRLLSRSAATRLVDRMEAAGLVERTQDPADRRGTNVALSDEGQAAFRHSAPVHRRGIERHFLGRLDADEIQAMGAIMERLADDPVPAGESRAAS